MDQIVGRDSELETIATWLGMPTSVLLLEGEAGIGKTMLWRAGVDFPLVDDVPAALAAGRGLGIEAVRR